MQISLAWWNTSLAPIGRKSEASAESRAVAGGLTHLLANDLGFDLIALAEVSLKEIDAMRSTFIFDGFEFIEHFESAGRTTFDLCTIYRSSKLRLLDRQALTIRKGSRNFKLGQQMEFQMAGSTKPLHFIASHWPSRLWTEQDHSDRHLLGIRLRDVVDAILTNDPEALIVLAGDYNDEPFDRSLSEQLMATRDKSLVAARPQLLYNPFWRYLCYSHDAVETDTGPRLAGTYFHSGGACTQWRTFDQIIFSSGLTSGTNWELDESRTLVLNVPTYSELVTSSSHQFDHLPVTSVIRMRQNG